MSALFNIGPIELRCPTCKAVTSSKAHGEPWVSKCLKCDSFNWIEPELIQKPNNVLFTFHSTAIPKREKALKPAAQLVSVV